MDILFNPIRYLWRFGPEPFFYGGKNTSEICSTLTGVPVSHWTIHASECDAVVDRHIHAWNTFFFVVLYFSTLHSLVNSVLSTCIHVCCVRRRASSYIPVPCTPPFFDPGIIPALKNPTLAQKTWDKKHKIEKNVSNRYYGSSSWSDGSGWSIYSTVERRLSCAPL